MHYETSIKRLGAVASAVLAYKCLTFENIRQQNALTGFERKTSLDLIYSSLIAIGPNGEMDTTQSRHISPKGSPMRLGTLSKTALIGISALLWVATAPAQQIRFFPDFTSVALLQMNGGAHQATWHAQKVLRLTDGYPGFGTFHPENTTSWFTGQQPVNSGFTTYFKFQIHTAGICCAPADGFAFVIQNATSTDATYGATGALLTARGVGYGGLGYAGIPNSLAVEFDTHQDPNNGPPFWDPDSNHVAVQGCGINTNGPVHDPNHTYTIGNNHNVKTCLVASGYSNSIPHLGVDCGASKCVDDPKLHEVVIEYTAPAQQNGNGTLMVYIDQPFIPGTHTPCPNTTTPGCPVAAVPAVNILYNIDGSQNAATGLALALDDKGNNTLAYVGFTASQTLMPQAHDILAWEFTPHTPTTVTQVIQNGGMDNHFVFGVHDTTVTYFPGFVNTNNISMSVTATPWDRDVFYQQRLAGTKFSNEQCVVYLGTGNNTCIVYSITCQDTNGNAVTCPASVQNTCTDGHNDPGCIVFKTSYTTADNLTATNADYLKTDPIGSNNWNSIFLSFDSTVFDPRTTGTGDTPSDFVATFRPSAP